MRKAFGLLVAVLCATLFADESANTARVRIGTPIDARSLWHADEDEKTNLERITETVRQTVIELGKELEREQA